ncbi:MAG TPA: hypothetical protein VFK09_06985 [Gemmatimonadales bacterium]|jgi:hypothetical protein|nr:hypothetical protein [Gemmatimonadales bacterium]
MSLSLVVRRTAALIGVAAPLAAGMLSAQEPEIPPPVEVTPFIGYYLGGGLYQKGDATATLADAVTFGGRLAWILSPTFGVELTYARTDPDLRLPSTTQPGTFEVVGDVTLDQLDLDAQIGYSTPREMLYLAFGPGLVRFSPTITGADAGRNTRASANVGLGYKRFFGALGLRLEGRYRGVFTGRATDIDISCGGTTGCYTYSKQVFSSAEFTAGLTARF